MRPGTPSDVPPSLLHDVLSRPISREAIRPASRQKTPNVQSRRHHSIPGGNPVAITTLVESAEVTTRAILETEIEQTRARQFATVVRRSSAWVAADEGIIRPKGFVLPRNKFEGVHDVATLETVEAAERAMLETEIKQTRARQLTFVKRRSLAVDKAAAEKAAADEAAEEKAAAELSSPKGPISPKGLSRAYLVGVSDVTTLESAETNDRAIIESEIDLFRAQQFTRLVKRLAALCLDQFPAGG